MLTLPPDDNNQDNNVPYKLEPTDTKSALDLTMEQQFFLRKINIELEGRDKELVDIINNLQRQVFAMQNFLKSENPFK